MTDLTILIGTWHEKEKRTLTRGTGYAADVIVHETVPGDYPLYMTLVTGYLIPMPRSLQAVVTSEKVHSRYYSGFGGVNYHCREDSDLGPSSVVMYPYAYKLQNLLDQGIISLLPEAEVFLSGEHVHEHGLTWDELRNKFKSYDGAI